MEEGSNNKDLDVFSLKAVLFDNPFNVTIGVFSLLVTRYQGLSLTGAWARRDILGRLVNTVESHEFNYEGKIRGEAYNREGQKRVV